MKSKALITPNKKRGSNHFFSPAMVLPKRVISKGSYKKNGLQMMPLAMGIQQKGKGDPPEKFKIEVVNKKDKETGKRKTKLKTTRSREEKISSGVTATASETTSDEDRKTTAEIKAKDKKTGLFVAGKAKATETYDPSGEDEFSGSVKVGGKWTPLKNDYAKVDFGTSVTFESSSVPKYSFDGKTVFFPKSTVRPDFMASFIASTKGYTAEASANLSWEVNKALSLTAGITGSYDSELGGALSGKAGITITFGK